MGNLAHEIRRRNEQQPKREPQIQPQPQIQPKKKKITLGEKLIAVVFTGVFLYGSIHLVANAAEVDQLNRQIQDLEGSVKKEQEVISDLNIQISHLSKPERIWEIAKKLGLQLNGDNVKTITVPN